MNPYLLPGLGEGFPYSVSLVGMLLVARQKFVFWRVSCLTFRPFLGARILSGLLELPSFIPFTCCNFCFLFLESGKLPVFPQQAGRVLPGLK